VIRVTLDRLAWARAVDLGSTGIERLKEDLTLVVENPYAKGVPPEVSTHYERNTLGGDVWFGMPREYFFKTFTRFEVFDCTQYSHLKGPWTRPPKFEGLLRPGQQVADEAVIKAYREGQTGGWIKATCGAGKTITALHLIARMKTPTIVLVHKCDLMDQWEREINRFMPEARVVKVRANEPCVKDAHIVIATFQTLYSRLESFRASGFFDHFGFLVSDESHRVPSQTFSKVANSFSARYKLGLTATPDRRDGLKCLLDWSIGPQLVTMRGQVVKGSYYVMEWEAKKTPPKIRGGGLNTSKLITMIAEDEDRNKMIANVCMRAIKAGRKTLVLTDRVKQLDSLEGLLSSSGSKIVKYRSTDDMESATADECRVVLATYGMFGEGTDIPSLDTLVLATPRSRVAQMVGRIQRPTKEKKPPMVVDVVDRAIPYANGLFGAREKVYTKLDFTRERKK